jgi:hypothetical protein
MIKQSKNIQPTIDVHTTIMIQKNISFYALATWLAHPVKIYSSRPFLLFTRWIIKKIILIGTDKKSRYPDGKYIPFLNVDPKKVPIK